MTQRIMDGQLRTPQIDARINQRRSLDMRHNAPVTRVRYNGTYGCLTRPHNPVEP